MRKLRGSRVYVTTNDKKMTKMLRDPYPFPRYETDTEFAGNKGSEVSLSLPPALDKPKRRRDAHLCKLLDDFGLSVFVLVGK